MKPRAMSKLDAALLKHRMLIETVIGQLKSETQIQRTNRGCVNCVHISGKEAFYRYGRTSGKGQMIPFLHHVSISYTELTLY